MIKYYVEAREICDKCNGSGKGSPHKGYSEQWKSYDEQMALGNLTQKEIVIKFFGSNAGLWDMETLEKNNPRFNPCEECGGNGYEAYMVPFAEALRASQ